MTSVMDTPHPCGIRGKKTPSGTKLCSDRKIPIEQIRDKKGRLDEREENKGKGLRAHESMPQDAFRNTQEKTKEIKREGDKRGCPEL